jgi:hypothetical protein
VNRAIVYAAALVTVLGNAGLAQSNAASPEEVARQFFKAEDEGRWLDAARFLDLTRFESVRQQAVKSARAIRDRPPATAESLMQWQPDMPRAAAEYQVTLMNKSMADYDFLGSEFARVASADSLAALPIDVAAARWLEAKDPRWRSEVADKRALKGPRAKCGPSVVDSAALSAAMSGAAHYEAPKALILGTATAGDSAAYVVVAESFAASSMRGIARSDEAGVGLSPRVLQLSRIDGKWKIIPTMDIVGSTGNPGGGMTVSIICEPEKPAKVR